MSNDTDTEHDISIAAGTCRDSANGTTMTLSSAMVKRIDAAWAAESTNGGLFSGAVANTTWYHVFLIEKDSDRSVDAGFDTSLTAANIPAGYTEYRRIGSVLTDGSANIRNFIQHGDYFFYTSPILDIDDGATGVARNTAAVSAPLDVRTLVIGAFSLGDNAADTLVYISCPDQTDIAPSTTATPLGHVWLSIASKYTLSSTLVLTDTSSQISYRTSADGSFKFSTYGYIDGRGKSD
jgi:hypothetical protein